MGSRSQHGLVMAQVSLLLLITLCLGSEGVKERPELKLTRRKLKECNTAIKELAQTLADLKTNVTDIMDQSAVGRSGSMRSTGTDATNVIAIADATYTSATEKCGWQMMMGLTATLDVVFQAGTATQQTGASFISVTGNYITPIAGWYNICGFLRFKKGGNAVDVNIFAGGASLASFGDAVGDDWRSTGTCFIAELGLGAAVYLQAQSTGGEDCVEETGWFYTRLTAYLINANS